MEKERETGAERGDLIALSDPTTVASPDGPEREMDGALGVPGGQPDVSPSGPGNNNELPEPKVKILFELGTRHTLRAFASYFHFSVKSDF